MQIQLMHCGLNHTIIRWGNTMTLRTINRSLIVHNDFALGYGPVIQTRGSNTAAEQKVELDFIFRTVDEIRVLDFVRYTRVSLHTLGPVINYYFDITSAAVDDGDTVLAPLPVVSLGRWIKTGVTPAVLNEVTASFADVTHAVNTSPLKQAGFMAWNSTTNKPIWAVGSDDNSLWVDATGATAHTPV